MTSMIRRCVEYEDHDAPMSRVEVPTLGVALILSFGPTMRVDGQTVSSFLVGMWDKPALTEHDGEAHGIQIDLAPAVAYALVGGQMDELTNRVLDVSDLEVLNVDRLLETGGAAAADELTNAVQHGPSVSREVNWAYTQLQRHPSTRIAWLADEIGWSRSHLVTAFDEKWDFRPSASLGWPASDQRSTDSRPRRRSPPLRPSAGTPTSRISRTSSGRWPARRPARTRRHSYKTGRDVASYGCRMSDIIPVVPYEDIKSAHDFLCDALQFTSAGLYEVDGTVVHGEVQLEGRRIWLHAAASGLSTPNQAQAQTGGVVVLVADVEAHFAHAKSRGATILSEPTDQDYGQREYAVLDPEGHSWWIATPFAS